MDARDVVNVPGQLGRRMAAAGLTQAALATAAGLSRPHLADLIGGRRPDPRASTLVRLAVALECPVDDLLRPAGEKISRKSAKTS